MSKSPKMKRRQFLAGAVAAGPALGLAVAAGKAAEVGVTAHLGLLDFAFVGDDEVLPLGVDCHRHSDVAAFDGDAVERALAARRLPHARELVAVLLDDQHHRARPLRGFNGDVPTADHARRLRLSDCKQ